MSILERAKRRDLRAIAAGTMIALAALGAACGDGRRPAEINGGTLEGDRTVMLGIAACHGKDNSATVRETDREVTIKVTTDAPRSGDACADGVRVELEAPLGDRAVVDGITGARVAIPPMPRNP